MPTGIPKSGYRVRYPYERTRATEHPTTLDIAWAAGIYEGEGSCDRNAGGVGGRNRNRVVIIQKDRWLLEKMQRLFGGSIYPHNGNCSKLQMTGARARGFLMTIYLFLSPRRREQARPVLANG